jgi:hypothetical protein
MKTRRFLLPLGVFAVLLAFLGVGLRLRPQEIPSPLIGRQAPSFSLPRVDDAALSFKSGDMRGKVAAQCLGLVVRALPRRASGASGIVQTGRRARRRLELQRCARRQPALVA